MYQRGHHRKVRGPRRRVQSKREPRKQELVLRMMEQEHRRS